MGWLNPVWRAVGVRVGGKKGKSSGKLQRQFISRPKMDSPSFQYIVQWSLAAFIGLSGVFLSKTLLLRVVYNSSKR